MKEPEKPTNENERLNELYAYDLINNIGQAAFDDIVKIAAHICNTPISLITLITEDKQIFKAKVGLDGVETSRAVSFCGHGILTPDQPFTVNSASSDERFADNPLVTGAPFIEFYAGVPLKTISGHGLGSLCVIDTKARQLNEDQIEMLKLLSQQVMRLFELKRNTKALEKKDQALSQTIEQQNTFAADVCHDMKMSMRNIELTAEIIKKTNEGKLPEQSIKQIFKIKAIAKESMAYINSLDKFTSSLREVNADPSVISTQKLITRVVSDLIENDKIEVNVAKGLPNVLHSPIVLNHIFYNLIKVSSDKTAESGAKIDIRYNSRGGYHEFEFSDNFSENYKNGNDYKILLNTGEIELAIVRQLTFLTGGKLEQKKNENNGTTYCVQIPIQFSNE